MATKRGLQLDRVVLLGRTFEEYSRFFDFNPSELAGKKILDVASGVSSFCAEADEQGIDVTAVDPIYDLPPRAIKERCEADLEEVYRSIDLPTYRWNSYRDPQQMKGFRERAYQTFLPHYEQHRDRKYTCASLPSLPFETDSFDMTFLSYFLFVYEEKLSRSFHAESIREIMRVTRGEARIYPLVTFEAQRSSFLDDILADPAMADLRFEEVPTDFEFLIGSNAYLRIKHA